MLRWKLIANTRPYESIRVALEAFTTYVTAILIYSKYPHLIN